MKCSPERAERCDCPMSRYGRCCNEIHAMLADAPKQNAESCQNQSLLHPKHNDGQEDAALDLLEAAKNTLYGIFKGDPHATHNAANMRNRIDVFLQGRQIDRLAARQQPLAATEPTAEEIDLKTMCDKSALTVKYDLSPAIVEGKVRDRLIELGWTPPAAPKVATDTSGTEGKS